MPWRNERALFDRPNRLMSRIWFGTGQTAVMPVTDNKRQVYYLCFSSTP
jgi:hypothetical protein